MTRDGFFFLVMGFTGEKAAQFKEAYIEAFNKMEELLKNQKLAVPQKIEWDITPMECMLRVNGKPALPESLVCHLLRISDYVWQYCKQQAENSLVPGLDFAKFTGEEAAVLRRAIARIPFLRISRNGDILRLWTFDGVNKVYSFDKRYDESKLQFLNDLYFSLEEKQKDSFSTEKNRKRLR